MAAGANDFFTNVGSPGSATTLAAPGHIIAGTSITVGATTNWPTTTATIFAMDTVSLVNGVEVRDVGSYTEWRGLVTSSTGVGSMTLMYGTDQNYPAGSTTRVYIPVASSRENRLVDGLIVSHNQDGTMITSLPLTTPKITTGIKDSSGNTIIPFTGSSSTTSIKQTTTAVGPTYVESGCVWSGDAYASTKVASMTAGVVYINGVRLTVAVVTARTFTASKDTYVDLTNNADGTALITYTEVTNNAASPALAANGLRIAIIVTGASNIAAASSVNQGTSSATLPTGLKGSDSLGNIIFSQGQATSTRTVIPYKFFAYLNASNQTLSSTAATKVTLNAEAFDTGNNFDSATNYRFTAPVSGFYQVDLAIGTTITSGGTAVVYLYKNGSELCRADAGSGGTTNVAAHISGLHQLWATDYLEVFVSNTVGNTATIRGGTYGGGTTVPTYFSGYLASSS